MELLNVSNDFFFKCFWFRKNEAMVLQSTSPLAGRRLPCFRVTLACIFQLLYTSLIQMFSKVFWRPEKYFITFLCVKLVLFRGKKLMGKLEKPDNVCPGESSRCQAGVRPRIPCISGRHAGTMRGRSAFGNLLESKGKEGCVQWR